MNHISWSRQEPPTKIVSRVAVSKYFPSPALLVSPHHSDLKKRSNYFESSPDSCLGSAVSFDWGSAYTQSAVDYFRECPKFRSHGVRHLCERLCYLRAYEV